MKKGNHKISPEEKKLIRRYLIWCYKTTKETGAGPYGLFKKDGRIQRVYS